MKKHAKPAKRRLSDQLVEQHDGVRHPKHRHYDRSTGKQEARRQIKDFTG